MKQKRSKVVLVGLGLVMTLGLIGCGKNSDNQKMPEQNTGNINNTSESTGVNDNTSGRNVTKKQVNDVRAKLEELKKEALKIQMDKTLSKEEKAVKLEALQEEIKQFTK